MNLEEQLAEWKRSNLDIQQGRLREHFLPYMRGVWDIVERLMVETDLLFAPASAKYHGNHWGGLIEHMINVKKALMKIKDSTNYSDQTIARLAFFHDLCKINYYEPYLYRGEVKFRVKDALPIGHGSKSIVVALKWGFDLTDQEMIAIRWHMSRFDTFYETYAAQEKYVYAVDQDHFWLQIADQIASHMEGEKKHEA